MQEVHDVQHPKTSTRKKERWSSERKLFVNIKNVSMINTHNYVLDGIDKSTICTISNRLYIHVFIVTQYKFELIMQFLSQHLAIII